MRAPALLRLAIAAAAAAAACDSKSGGRRRRHPAPPGPVPKAGACGPTDHPGDCAALRDLAASAKSAGWKKNTHWLEKKSVCGWYGVTCAGGRVTQLALHQNNLAGSLPSSLGNLTELQVLDLAGTRPVRRPAAAECSIAPHWPRPRRSHVGVAAAACSHFFGAPPSLQPGYGPHSCVATGATSFNNTEMPRSFFSLSKLTCVRAPCVIFSGQPVQWQRLLSCPPALASAGRGRWSTRASAGRCRRSSGACFRSSTS